MSVFQPKGAGTTHKEGTAVVQAPKGSGWFGSNYVMDGKVSNLPSTGTISDNLANSFNSETVNTQTFNVNGTGNSELVAAITERKIEVVGYVVVVDGDTDLAWKSDTNNLITGIALAGSGGISYSGPEAFSTNVGEALNMTLDAGVNAAGHVSYKIV